MKRATLILIALAWGCGGSLDSDTSSTSPGGAGAQASGGSGGSGGAGPAGAAGAQAAGAGQAGSAGACKDPGPAPSCGQGTTGPTQATLVKGPDGCQVWQCAPGGCVTPGSTPKPECPEGQEAKWMGGTCHGDWFCMPTGAGGAGGEAGAGGAGGEAGAAGAGPCQAAKPLPDPCDCLPQGTAGYYWDGNQCAGLVACCPQVEGGKLYKTEQECKADHVECASCAPTTLGPDPCDCAPGKEVAWWDGKNCQSGLACCPKADGKLYDSVDACKKDHEQCPQVECWTDLDCPQANCPPCSPGCPVFTCVDHKCQQLELPPPSCAPECPPGCGGKCSYSDKKCGQGGPGAQVSCLAAPPCEGKGEPVCGCDGVVYEGACLAQAAGVDLSQLGNCKAPAGYFACGERFCREGIEYCRRYGSDIGGEADSYQCFALPAGCSDPGKDACQCVKGETCGSQCETDAKNNPTVTCFGG